MAVLAKNSITLAVSVDVSSVDNYYLLQSSTATPPTKPTTASPSNWSVTEPNYDGTTTNTLYVCQKTTLTDGTFYWSAVSKSSSYEAAKQAANAAAAASDAASTALAAAGTLEPPYTEVEWVESDGTQYVYLDWKPPIATFGFEADFIVRNTFNTTQAAWRSDTNKNNAGFIFGTRNSSVVNDVEFGTYSSYGYFRNGTATYSTSGLFKTDKTRQTVSYRGTSLKRGDGTTVTFARSSETANKPYANMAVFCYHDGLRRAGPGNVLYPSTTRIYSLKFYDGDVLKVDLVGAIRNRDGMSGLYDKVKGHFYPAAGMSCGNTVGTLGEPGTMVQALAKADLKVYVDNLAVSRMWRVEVPGLDKLEDGQKLTVYFPRNVDGTTPNAVAAAGIEGFAGQWDETVTTSYTNVYLKLDLADGSETEWIPCYYAQGTRLTSHYGSGIPVLLTYRENVQYGKTTTSAGTPVMRAWYADSNYNTDDVYTRYSDTVIAGLNGVKRYSLNMRDANGNWTSIMNQANNTAATGKTAYTGGLMLGNVLYHDSSSDIAAGGNTGRMKESHGGVDFRYDVNGVQNAAATELQFRKPVYLVGDIDAESGLFFLDQTKWWTQNPVDPTKVYVQLGTAYNSYYAIFLSVNNPTLVYDEDTEKLVPLSLTVTTFSNKYNTLVDTVDEHTTKVGTFEAQINGHYGTCATAAGTTAKEVRLDATANGWTPYKGAVIAVKFANANTTTSPTLTIKNSTGATTYLSAKAVKSYKGGALAASEYGWESGALLSFVYDGTQWALQDGGAIKRLGTAETTIQQTANNVLIKATATGASDSEKTAGGEAVIRSLINVAPSGVTIDASKLDIYGVVTIGGLASKNEVDSSIASLSASLEEFDDYVRGYFYENTSDTTAQEGKTYYQLTVVPAHYEAVSLSVGDDVSGLYVASGSTYVLTSDTTAVSGKTYYEYIPDEYDYEEMDVSPGASLNPNSVYERVYNEDSIASQLASANNRIDSAEDKVELQAGNLQALENSVDDRVSGLEQSLDDRASGLEARANAVDSDIENLSGRTQSLEYGMSTLGTQVRSAIQIDPDNGTVTVGYMDAGGAFQNYRTRTSANGFDMLDGNGKVVGHYGEEVQLGAIDGTHMEASGDYLLFLPKGVTSSDYDLDDPSDRESLLSKSVAYIAIDADGKSTFYMTRSVVVEDMYFGDGLWKFYRRSNRNMSLKWMGGE